MSKEIEKVITKIVTYDGMYYTIGTHTVKEIETMKKAREELLNHSVEEDEIIKELVNEDVCSLVKIQDDLIYLPFEAKIINKKEIKESLIQYN